jgi:hypothetical protein
MLMLTPAIANPLQSPAAAGGALAAAANVSLVVIAVAIVVLAIMGAMLMVRLYGVLGELRRSARQNFGPASDRARSISDNVEFITRALRTDVEKLNASIRALSDRLHQASDRMEERIEEFNALMEVVQDEAEDLFIDTASTVRGVREGARAIAGGEERRAQQREAERRIERGDGSYPAGPDHEPSSDDRPVERAAPPAAPGRAVPEGRD